MSGKLDQSLDAIMTDSKAGRPRGAGRGRPVRARKAKATMPAPTSGIQKNTRAPKGAPTAPAVVPQGDSKIIVSNLPSDINETLLKDFFGKAIGGVKKVLLSYGPNGRSRGEATIVFTKYTQAIEAQKQFNNVKVDNRPMKVEIVGAAAAVAAPVTLADRMSKPKNAAKGGAKAAAPKKAEAAKPVTNGAAAKAGGRGAKKNARVARAKPKTADELDAEMADYFGGANGATTNGEATNGTAQPAATNGGDDAMVDEVS